eukprot:m.221299 g.221299  ORF g.221299 m.221299 type:complete len:982 (-) comp10558_c0_seq1:166-3111(-)
MGPADMVKRKNVTGFTQGLRPVKMEADSPRSSVSSPSTLRSPSIRSGRVLPIQTVPEVELLEGIPQQFYEQSFDPTRHMLETIGSISDQTNISKCRSRKFQELAAVSKKLSQLIMQHQSGFVTALKGVSELQELLEASNLKCEEWRRHLARGDDGVRRELRLFQIHRRRLRLLALVRAGESILTIRDGNRMLAERLEANDLEGAVELYKSMTTLTDHGFTCFGDLKARVAETRELLEQHLDRGLTAECGIGCDIEKLTRIVRAYASLDMANEALDKFAYNFHAAPLAVARDIVPTFLVGPKTTPVLSTQAQLKAVAASVPINATERMIATLLTALAQLMAVFTRVRDASIAVLREQEARQDDVTETEPPPTPMASSTPAATPAGNDDIAGTPTGDAPGTPLSATDGLVPASPMPAARIAVVEEFSAIEYATLKMQQAARRLWQEVQKVVATTLAAVNDGDIELDVFLRILENAQRLAGLGELFGQCDSSTLTEAIRAKARAYVLSFHRRALEQLRAMLCGDQWESTPLPANFSLVAWGEFSFLRPVSSPSPTGGPPTGLPANGVPAGTAGRRVSWEDFRADPELFLRAVDLPKEVDISLPAVLDEMPAVASSPEEEARPSNTWRPTGSVTTCFVVRTIGCYIQLMALLKSEAGDVFACVTEMIDYYLYTVFNFFAADREFSLQGSLSPRGCALVERLEKLCGPQPPAPPATVQSPMTPEARPVVADVPQAELNPDINLRQPQTLFGMSARSIGAESLTFVARTMMACLDVLRARVPYTGPDRVALYYQQTVDFVREMRRFIYRNGAAKLLDYKRLLGEMTAIKWDYKEVPMQHNGYVDSIVAECTSVQTRIAAMGDRGFPAIGRATLWEELLLQLAMLLVDGYAAAKKCNKEGRLAMQLDVQQLVFRLRSITSVRFRSDIVEGYVKAYSYNEDLDLMEKWLREQHHFYSQKQLAGLLAILPIQKKPRERLAKVVDELKNPG